MLKYQYLTKVEVVLNFKGHSNLGACLSYFKCTFVRNVSLIFDVLCSHSNDLKNIYIYK